jgi:hypothetical protein
MRQSLILLVALVCLTACGSAEQRGIEAMVQDRLGQLATINEISDAVIYRRGNTKRSCVMVRYENQWGEEQPLVMIDGWYNFTDGTWATDNPYEIDADFSCAEHAASRGTILES